jgi:hypothetical protein
MSSAVRSLRRLPFPPALALPVAMLAIAALAIRPVSHAADLGAWSAGERATVTVTSASPPDLSASVAAAVVERALGLAKTLRTATVVEDRFHGTTVQELTYRDAAGRPTAVVRLSQAGRLLSVVRLGYRDAFANGRLEAAGALQRARVLLAALAIDPPVGMPAMRSMMNGTLWAVNWARAVGGVPVDGDGLTVRLWRSGDLHSVTLSERPLSVPAHTISAGEAQARLTGLLSFLLTADRLVDGSLSAASLRWVAPNDRFRPDAADAPATTLRLAYVFEMRFGGPSAAVLRAVTFWIDAETGGLIGGDVLE